MPTVRFHGRPATEVPKSLVLADPGYLMEEEEAIQLAQKLAHEISLTKKPNGFQGFLAPRAD